MAKKNIKTYKTEIDGLASVHPSASDAQRHAREALLSRDDISVAYADAGNGNYWRYHKNLSGSISRSKMPGNLP